MENKKIFSKKYYLMAHHNIEKERIKLLASDGMFVLKLSDKLTSYKSKFIVYISKNTFQVHLLIGT